MSERTARLILSAVAVLVMWGIVATVPEMAYVVVGIIATLGWQKAAAWRAGRRQPDGEGERQAEPPDVGAALRRLVGDDRGVLLTRLRDDLGAADTKAVRALLDSAGIRVRAGVRTAAGNGPGVHADDIPPAPPTPEDGCCCRSGANANGNNESGTSGREGLRVERIGQSGYILRDPADQVRHHQVRGH
ncbi:hypothetical protein [Streptomyces sp. NPDC004658]|uniref:hypothetical protein n=1 Tax=Streptomyces sp. NPDC004658 TaxID=3154672 RepID=UPI0033B2CE3F